MRVEVRRAWNIYFGAALAVASGLLMVGPVSMLVRLAYSDVLSPAYVAVLAALVAGVIAAHELIHMGVAWALRVRGLRVRFVPRLLSVAMDYDYMTPQQYCVVAVAPQALTVLLTALALNSFASGDVQAAALLLTGAIVNVVGGIPEIFLTVYFGVFHGSARRLMLLYDEKGEIAGGVVEEPGRVIVYTL